MWAMEIMKKKCRYCCNLDKVQISGNHAHKPALHTGGVEFYISAFKRHRGRARKYVDILSIAIHEARYGLQFRNRVGLGIVFF